MDYYFSAASDVEALRAKELPAGPTPGSEGFDSVEAKGVMATALEELVASWNGISNPLVMARTLPLWPEAPANAEDYEPGPFLMRLPDGLRDELAKLEVTPALAEKWADDLSGYKPDEAERAARRIVQLARASRDRSRSIYWWSEM